jgi:hypothetical protein
MGGSEKTEQRENGMVGALRPAKPFIILLALEIESGKPSYLFREKFPWNHYRRAFISHLSTVFCNGEDACELAN